MWALRPGNYSKYEEVENIHKAWFSYVGKIPDGPGFYCPPTVPD